MKKTKIGFWGLLFTVSMAATAAVPEGYYDSLNGKQGEELQSAIKALSANHTRVTYNTKTWPAFEKTDVRMLNGRQIWWDMYSNNIVYLPAHDALNIEHAVANSWWGGKSGNNDAYSDLFHLNPSDQNANNTKSSHPWGETSDARLFDNGLTRIGTPVEGQGGGNATVFEPADEYKGDFARAAFYLFTAYPDAPWKEDSQYMYVINADNKMEIAPWAVEMLLRWHRSDPVDSKEVNRNEAIFALQKNRNPFIDHPELAEYVWGDNRENAYELGAVAEAVNRPDAPVFADMRLTGVNTYAHRWWNGFPLIIDHSEGALMVSIDGRNYFESEGEHYILPAEDMNETHTYRAYAKIDVDGRELRSSIAKIDLIPLDPNETNFSLARWERIDELADVEDGTYYLILSSNTLHAMSTEGGNPTRGFLDSAGFVEFDSDGRVVEIPANTAVVKFEAAEDGKHRLLINDTRGRQLGYWYALSKNQMRVKSDEYTPGAARFNGEGNFIFEFTQFGSLQFNKTQPRFLNYESSQCPVYLYKFVDFDQSEVESIDSDTPWAVGVDGSDILVDEGTAIFDMSGRRVDGRNLTGGVYIVVGAGKTKKIML